MVWSVLQGYALILWRARLTLPKWNGSNVRSGLVHLLMDQRIPGPMSCRCPEPRWFVKDPTSLARDNILIPNVKSGQYLSSPLSFYTGNKKKNDLKACHKKLSILSVFPSINEDLAIKVWHTLRSAICSNKTRHFNSKIILISDISWLLQGN